jgi:asparagine synthetase B (glutamine-hydrolysing)
MISDVPLGAFVSGGIDSSAVATLMAKHSESALNTYSIGYGGSGVAEYYNELPHARVVAEQPIRSKSSCPVLVATNCSPDTTVISVAITAVATTGYPSGAAAG